MLKGSCMGGGGRFLLDSFARDRRRGIEGYGGSEWLITSVAVPATRNRWRVSGGGGVSLFLLHIYKAHKKAQS